MGLTGYDVKLKASLPGLPLERGERGAGAGRRCVPSPRQQSANRGFAAPAPRVVVWSRELRQMHRAAGLPAALQSGEAMQMDPLIWEQAPPLSRYVSSRCCNPFMVTGLGRIVSSRA